MQVDTARPFPTKGSVLVHYLRHRKVFDRILRRCGMPVEVAKKLLVLWMWIDWRLPQCNLIASLASLEPCLEDVFERHIRRGRAILASLLHYDASRVEHMVALLKVSWIDVLPCLEYRDVIISGMAGVVCTGIPRLIFAKVPEEPGAYIFEPFDPLQEQASETERTLFVRFEAAAGPVNTIAVTRYFLRKWGLECFWDVLTMNVPRRSPPAKFLFGRLVFRETTFLELAFEEDSPAVFNIEGRIMWGNRNRFM